MNSELLHDSRERQHVSFPGCLCLTRFNNRNVVVYVHANVTPMARTRTPIVAFVVGVVFSALHHTALARDCDETDLGSGSMFGVIPPTPSIPSECDGLLSLVRRVHFYLPELRGCVV